MTVQGIYDTYNRVPSAGALATIYQQLNTTPVGVNTSVNFARCP